jgi:hypothetical protein
MEGKMEKGTKHGEIKSRSDYSIIQWLAWQAVTRPDGATQDVAFCMASCEATLSFTRLPGRGGGWRAKEVDAELGPVAGSVIGGARAGANEGMAEATREGEVGMRGAWWSSCWGLTRAQRWGMGDATRRGVTGEKQGQRPWGRKRSWFLPADGSCIYNVCIACSGSIIRTSI